ncbi:MAG: CBS domain-containing protein [Magnetococcales bacterium]|nr:CBS domain-containing protein [Magnetococcales bacterium]MBF0113511.1 CBS domain-containing protein [Magnetococcales bacterium]
MTIVRDCMFPDLITLSPSTTLAEAIRRLMRQPFGFAVVLDNMAPVGLVTEFDLLRWMVAGHDLSKATFKEFTLSIPQTVREDTPCQSLLNIYNNRRFRRFPVLNDENMLSGGITEKQIVSSLPRSELMAHYRVSDIIQGKFPAVSGELPFHEAARLMVAGHRGCLLLSDGEHLLGMVTEGDLLRFRTSPQWQDHAPLSQVPSTTPVTIEPDRNLLYALDLFVRSGHRRIPVVQRDPMTGLPRKLVGLLTQTDFLKQVVSSARTHKAILNPEDINDPAIWFEPFGTHRILALNEKGAAALEVDSTWVGRSIHDLARDPEVWGAITILLHNCGTLDRITLPLRTGGGSAVCTVCRFSLVHTPAGEDRIFWTLHGSESGRRSCG